MSNYTATGEEAMKSQYSNTREILNLQRPKRDTIAQTLVKFRVPKCER